MGATQNVDRPLRADAARNRELIVAAAREVFAETGIEASVEAIAARAGVGMGTLYRRFPTKESLVLAIFEERLEALAAAVEQVAELEPFAALEGYMARACRAMAEDRGLIHMLAEQLQRLPELGDGAAALRERYLEMLEPLVARARVAGAIHAGVHAADIAMLLRMLAVATSDDRLTPAPGVCGWERYLAMVLPGLRPNAERPPAAGAPRSL